MTTLDTIELLYEAFRENPTRLTYSTKTLCKQFAANEEQVFLARQLYRKCPNDFTVAQAMIYDEGIFDYGSIPASKFFDVLTTDQLNKLEKKLSEVEQKWGEITSQGVDKSYKELSTKSLKDSLKNQGGLVHQDEELEQWEVKQKWVKGPEGSQLMVKKDQDLNLRKDFDDFLKSYKPITKSFKTDSDDGILFVYLSDQHIGAETKQDSLFPNEYNAEKVGDRMQKTAQEVLKLDQRFFLNKIVIVNLGDAVDGYNGYTTRGGHKLPQNLSNREVYNTFLQVHLDFIYALITNCDCKNISYVSVGDSNHGGDFEYICNKSLEAISNLKYPNVQFHVGEKFIEHFTFGEHTFLFCHGKDSEDMKFGLPKNLDPKTELWIKSYVDQMQIKSKYVHLVKGDLHLANSEWSFNLRYKNCLSMYGSSKWIQTNFMKNTSGVSFDILHKDTLMEHNIFF